MPISTRISSEPARKRTDIIVTMSITWQELGDGQGFTPGFRPSLNMTSDRRPEPYGKPRCLLRFTDALRAAGYRFGIGSTRSGVEDQVILTMRVRPAAGVVTADALNVVRTALRTGFGEELNEIS